MKPTTALAAVTTAAVVAGTLAFTMASSQAETTPATDSLAPQLAASAADSLVAKQPKLFQLSDQDKLQQAGIVRGAGALQYVAYQRSFKGLPVTGGDAVVVTNAKGQVLSSWTAQSYRLDVATTPTISAKAAAKVARGQLAKVTSTGAPQLTVVAQDNGRLAYDVAVTGFRKAEHGLADSRQHIFVDAKTGKVLPQWGTEDVMDAQGNGFYYGNVDITTSQSSGSFAMADPTRPGLQCTTLAGKLFTKATDSWGNGQGTDLETACVDGMYGVSQEWDMLKNWLGRNGIDGNGKAFPIQVGWTTVNAQWNGSFGKFGRSSDGQRQLTNIDVLGHEFGHAINQFTPGSSGSGWEAKGMNESTGDIFGALTEFYANNPKDKPDYEVGELANLSGDGPIRYMYDPSKKGDPNCFDAATYPKEEHEGAGPQNHWFYLLAEGNKPTDGQPTSPTCNGRDVSGVGIKKAGQIYMATLMRKTSSWTHTKARAASIAAAKELFPGGPECATTKAAWDAVTVPATAGEVTCDEGTPRPTPTDPTPSPSSPSPTPGEPTPSPTQPTPSEPTPSPTRTDAPSPTPTTPAPSRNCPGFQHYDSGSLARNERTYSYEFRANSGRQRACLTVPKGADFDLTLEKRYGSTWLSVASSAHMSGDESISYYGTSGQYRYRIVAYTGSGFSTLGFDAP